MNKDNYLRELARYIVLNPVRAEMVRSAEQWPWSSYHATAGLCPVPVWLSSDWLLAAMTEKSNKAEACELYFQHISQGKGQPSPWKQLKNQIYLGPENFVDEMQCKLSPDAKLHEVPAIQKRLIPKSLTYYSKNIPSESKR